MLVEYLPDFFYDIHYKIKLKVSGLSLLWI